MACPPFEFLLIVKESAYTIQKAGSIATLVGAGDAVYIRLAGANRFAMRPVPTKRKIQFGGGFASPGYAVADQWVITGNLEVELCYSQAQLLLDWALTIINGGQTLPWTTTEGACDLASCTVYHGIMRDDGTVKRRRYLGVKVPTARLASSAGAGLTTLTLSLRAAKYDGNLYYASSDPDDTAFPAPADTAFPTDPLLFIHTFNQISVGGSTVLYLNSLDINVNNHLDGQYYTSPFLLRDNKRGRSATAAAEVLYTATPNWRADYEALTSRAFSVGWANGSNTVTINYQGNNLLDTLTDNLTPGVVYKQNVTWEYQRDTSTGDITFTYT